MEKGRDARLMREDFSGPFSAIFVSFLVGDRGLGGTGGEGGASRGGGHACDSKVSVKDLDEYLILRRARVPREVQRPNEARDYREGFWGKVNTCGSCYVPAAETCPRQSDSLMQWYGKADQQI